MIHYENKGNIFSFHNVSKNGETDTTPVHFTVDQSLGSLIRIDRRREIIHRRLFQPI